MAAPEKLHALLEIVRLTVTRQGVSIAELSESLGLSNKKIREAVSLLSVIGVPPYRPDQLLDIFVDEDDMVYCDLDQGLAIEPRLSLEECEALALALRWVSPHSRQMLDDLVSALPKNIEHSVRGVLAGFGQDLADGEIASVELIQDAIERKDAVQLFYYSASRQTEDQYSLVPWKILHFETGRYLWAGVRSDEAGRLFRLDRIRGVERASLRDEEYITAKEPPKSAQPTATSEVQLETLVVAPALEDYLRRLGGSKDGSQWVLSYASEAWLFSRLRELTGKVRVIGPSGLADSYKQWIMDTLSSYDVAGAQSE